MAHDNLEKINKVISDCIDVALSSFSFVDKRVFYQYLNQTVGYQSGISDNFESFHEALKNVYGRRHYLIDRKIVQVLHQRAKAGTYSHTDEIAAFSRIIDIFLKETEENLARRRKIDDVEKLTRKLRAEVKEAQAKAKEAERLAVIGQTAGMVGHDIRNPLQAIISDLYLIKQEMGNVPDGEAKKNIGESVGAIEENVVYINKIISDLQDYTRPLRVSQEELDAKDIIGSVLDSVKISPKIKTSVTVQHGLTVYADAFYLRRILSNLVINAVQAMPEGGELSVKACRNRNIVISVEDSGVGIADKVKPKVFTPLFTTKSKGQGLGLVVVKRLVEASGGKISFESQEGKGTKFKVQLPIRNVDETPRKQISAQ